MSGGLLGPEFVLLDQPSLCFFPSNQVLEVKFIEFALDSWIGEIKRLGGRNLETLGGLPAVVRTWNSHPVDSQKLFWGQFVSENVFPEVGWEVVELPRSSKLLMVGDFAARMHLGQRFLGG